MGERTLSHPRLMPILREAWETGFSTKSNFARIHADDVAAAACLNLITTRLTDHGFGKLWRISPKGCRLIFKGKPT